MPLRRPLLLLAALAVLSTAAPAAAQQGGAAQPAAGSQPSPARDTRGDTPSGAQYDRFAARAAKDGEVRVIAGFRSTFRPEASMDRRGVERQRADYDERRREVLAALQGTRHAVVHTYETVPYVALKLSAGAVRALERSGRAASLQEDEAVPPAMAQSGPLVETTESFAMSRSGSGSTVAVLDTGIEKTHPFLQQAGGAGTKVVSEACFSLNGNCPGGVTQSTAAGSGEPCTYAASGCTHGTHVAGIAAGLGSSFSGVAKSSRLISVQVFSRFEGASCGAGESPCTLTYGSDQIKGLEHVYSLRDTYRIGAVNMSIGGGRHTAHCDGDARKPAIDNLRAARIATVIASGNNGFSDSVGDPGCISSAVTVASTTKDDFVSAFSNTDDTIDVFAPGSSINSSVPGGGFGIKSGTSMATPHVAGAFGVLRSIDPNATVDAMEAAIETTGKVVTDPTNDVARGRLRVLSAGASIKDTGFRSGGTYVYQGADVASNGVGLAQRAGGPASANIEIGGIPSGATIKHAFLYWQTVGGPDSRAVLRGTSRLGTLVGAGHHTFWASPYNTAVRTYKATLPTSVVPGNGTYSVSGIGGGNVDAQGASLVIIYTAPGVAQTGRVYVREGALGITGAPSTMKHTFTGLTVPAAPSQVRWHGAVSDGQPQYTENAVLIGSSAISPVNWYEGTDGPMWDDDRVAVSRSLLPAGATTRNNSISVPAHEDADGLSWAYAILAYRHP